MRIHLSPLLTLLVALSAASRADADSVKTLRYTILSSDRKSGTEVDTFGPNGKLDSTYEFNDRGRGPKIEAHYVFAANGLPTHVDITGIDYLKSPVDEHFAVEDGVAHWKSTSENGSGTPGPFYLSINGPSAEFAGLVKALKKAGPAGLKLFPAGQAHLEKVTDTTIHDHGESMHVTEYAVTGLGFTASTVWLDDDMQFFATPGNWGAFMREGWEGTNHLLYDLQTKTDNERYGKLATQLSQHLQHPMAIEHVRVFDSRQATMKEDQTVIIGGERITESGPASSVKIPSDAEHIDGHGKTLLPGLFDMHSHAQALDGILDIASGVTTVRDMGNDIDELAQLQKSWQDGTAIGPRVWKAGLIDGRDKMQAPIGIFVSTQEEANAAVRKYADLGYIQIKLYSSLNPAFVPGIIKESHDRGLRVSGHIPNGMTAAQFVEEGADEIQHINFIFLNFFADKVKDTRTPERFTAVGEYAAGLDLNSKPVDDFIALLLAHHTTVDITLATFEGMFIGRPKEVSPDFASIISRLPAQIQRGAYTGGLPVTSANDQRYKDSYTAMLKMSKRLYDAGVPILAGTDATAGLMLHRELELEVKAGIPPAKALQNATFLAASVLKQQSDLGSIETGKRADLLLVEGDPSKNISDIRRCRMTIKNGVVFDSAQLYAAVGILPSE
jgi:imidazolonepropionase-like amidohydrolase